MMRYVWHWKMIIMFTISQWDRRVRSQKAPQQHAQRASSHLSRAKNQSYYPNHYNHDHHYRKDHMRPSSSQWHHEYQKTQNYHNRSSDYMWCDQAKWVWTWIKWKSSFRFNLCIMIRAILCWKPHQDWTSCSGDIAILVMFKTLNYKGNWMLLLAVSKNQY